MSSPPSGSRMVLLLCHTSLSIDSEVWEVSAPWSYLASLRDLMALNWCPDTPKYVLLQASRRIVSVICHHLPQAATILSNTRSSTCSSNLLQARWCINTIYSAAGLRIASRLLSSLEPNGIGHLHSIAHHQHTVRPSTLTVGQQGIGGVDSFGHRHFWMVQPHDLHRLVKKRLFSARFNVDHKFKPFWFCDFSHIDHKFKPRRSYI